jgi:hypothetical protein
LAEHLHKTVGEILNIPASEIYGWAAYFNIVKEKSESGL